MTLWIGYAKAGKEFDVQSALSEIGITCHVAKKVEAKRSGKQRRPEPVTTPILPNYVFIDVSADRYLELVSIKHLAQSKTMVGDLERKLVDRFLDAAQRSFDQAADRISMGERLSAYEPGDVLDILTGAFSDKLVRFKRVVEGSHQVDDVIVGEVELMGRKAEVPFDPLDVRAAE